VQQQIREAKDSTATLVDLAPDRLRQGVIRAVREGVAVYDEQGPGHAAICTGIMVRAKPDSVAN
jgi:hypothetical protein